MVLDFIVVSPSVAADASSPSGDHFSTFNNYWDASLALQAHRCKTKQTRNSRYFIRPRLEIVFKAAIFGS